MALVLEEQYLPATLTSAPMTDEEFAAFCAEHPDLFFEMTANQELVVMPPNYSSTSAQDHEIGLQLGNWAKNDGRGIVTDSCGGFVLPNGARRSPDAAWTARDRLRALSVERRDRYWHLSPDFVIELRSTWDRLPVLREKMREWIENGAALGWLIDPENRTVEIYRPDAEVSILQGDALVPGEGPVAGFVLDPRPVWEPLG